MPLPQLITDNTPTLLVADGRVGKTERIVDNKEFFELLKKKAYEDLNRMLTSETADKKINSYADLMQDLGEYYKALAAVDGDIINKIETRQKKMGGYRDRLKLISMEKFNPSEVVTDKDVEFVINEGERLGYPEVYQIRNEIGKVSATVMAGKESWEKQLAQRNMPMYYQHFVNFIKAVKNKDYGTKEKE